MKKLILFAFLLLAVAAWSQSIPAGKSRFTVLVTDEHGAPVSNLTDKDFAIEDHGKRSSVQLEDLNPADSAGESAAGEFTNRSRASAGRGLVVLVLDTIHTRWVDEKDLRPGIVRYLGACASRNMPVSLLVMDPSGNLHVVHDYGTGSATLLAALDRVNGVGHDHPPAGDATPEVAAEASRLTDFIKGTVANYTTRLVPLRVSPEPVLRMFHTVAEATAGIPGRKALVWMSNLSPFEADEKTGMVLSLSRAGNSGFDNPSAPVEYGALQQTAGDRQTFMTETEMKPLRVLWKLSISALVSSRVAMVPATVRASAALSFDVQTLHAMKVLALLTGGREVHGSDPMAALSGLPEENLAAYSLSATSALDCKSDWCPLQISVSRPNARVVAPSGYFAGANVAQDRDLLTEGFASPIDFTGIPFTLKWTTTEADGAKKKLAFVVTFPPESGLPPAESNDLNLEIFVRSTAAHAEKGQDVNFNAVGNLPDTAAQQARQQGFALNNVLELAPGSYTVKFLVHDKLTGRLGTITLPLTVS